MEKIMSVKRFIAHQRDEDMHMRNHGDWVKYTDYAALEIEHKSAILTISAIMEMLGVTEKGSISEQVAELLKERDALSVESAGVNTRIQQLIQIINNADNSYCMCGEEMEKHTYAGCGHPTGMFDYHYNKWLESSNETPATNAAIASIRADGVEKFADDCDSDSMLAEPEDTEHYVLMAEKAREFAYKVRASKLDGDEQ